MDFCGSKRGQSIQIGFIILFAALIILFSTYQAFIVPNQNRQVEFNHNQEVRAQMQELRNEIVSAPGEIGVAAVTVQLGVRYPGRLVALNPGPPSGALRTDGATSEDVNLTLSNVEVAGEAGDYWNGTTTFNTGTVVYSPNYNEYNQAPDTVYEHTVLYDRFPDANLTVANQTFLDGTDLSLIALNGSLSESRSDAVSVEVRPVSTSENTLRIADSSGGPIEVELVSKRPAAYWAFLEETQSSVTDVRDGTTPPPAGFHTVVIEFDTADSYDLRLTKAGLGTRVTPEDTAYLTDIEGNGTVLAQDTSTELTLAVRDRYGNVPDNASGTTVFGEVADSGTLGSGSRTPDSDGEVTFTYTAPSSTTGEQAIEFGYVGIDGTFDASTVQNVSMEVIVGSASGGGGGNSVVFTDGGALKSVAGDGKSVLSYSTSNVKAVGPMADLDSDSNMEVPYVDQNGNLKIVEKGGSDRQTLDSSGQVATSKTRITVGDFDADSTDEVYYTKSNNNKIYKAAGSVSATQISTSANPKALAVGAVADIDADANAEIIYAGTSNELKHADSNDKATLESSIGSSSGVGLGNTVDITADANSEPLFVGGSQNIRYDEPGASSPTDITSSGPAKKSPIAAADIDDDGTDEVVYIDTNDELSYTEQDGTTKKLNDAGSGTISADAKRGVA